MQSLWHFLKSTATKQTKTDGNAFRYRPFLLFLFTYKIYAQSLASRRAFSPYLAQALTDT